MCIRDRWWTSNFFQYQLTDVVACIVALGAAFVLLRFWTPRGVPELRQRLGLEVEGHSSDEIHLPANRVWMALLPYAIVVVIFGIANLGTTIPNWLKSFKISFPWPGIETGKLLNAAGGDVKTDYSFAYINNPGTLLIISGLIVTIIYMIWDENGRYKLTWGQVGKEFTDTAYRMRWSAATILSLIHI